MFQRRPTWQSVWPAVAWMAVLAVLPWWLGLPPLLAMVATLLSLRHRLSARDVQLIRCGLYWGLPGVLLALQRGLGGDATAWAVALLGALAGYTLLVALEGWLDRRPPPDILSPAPTAAAEWPELAMAPVGPPAAIIELLPPRWECATDDFVDPRDPGAVYRDGAYHFTGGMQIEAVGTKATFSSDGRWFAAGLAEANGIVLWDRELQRGHRLPGWQLCGWHLQQPWLIDDDAQMPLPLSQVLELTK
ncbi:MAG: hypothetical protein EPN74_09780 [Rhodanobacter sp.]|nr:MAG: hypothetical protein EPN74_09780 [Rhodanobacter sp.]